jgi:hypothetical protein
MGRACGSTNGNDTLRHTVPIAPLQINDVKRSSRATRRVAMNCAAKQQAVSKPDITPHKGRSLPGRMKINTPVNAIPAATYRDMCAGSLSTHEAIDKTIKGARKLIVVACA